MIDPGRLAETLSEVRAELDAAAARAGRPAGAVELLPAGKYIAADEVDALLQAGVRRLGENRLQDMIAKHTASEGRLEFDFIGHLQRRKVRDVVPMVRLIHSVDSERIAGEIARRSADPCRVLVQVNVAEEPSKGGIVPGDLDGFVEAVSVHDNLVIGGLMSMPPLATDPESSRPHFAATRALGERLAERWRGRHDFGELSMGTSQDYRVAAEEGATLVRIGRGVIDRARVE